MKMKKISCVLLLASFAGLLGGCAAEVDTLEAATEETCTNFTIVEIRVDQPKYADGSTEEGVRDIYVAFSDPAEDVRLEVFESASGIKVADSFYQKGLYSPGQTSFALGVSGLKPLTDYIFTVSGKQLGEECDISSSGTFKTVDF